MEFIKRHTSKILTGVLLITFSVYCYHVLKYTINFPFYDDYYAVLEYLLNFNKEESYWKNILSLFSQHNEHRILLDRIIIISNYYIFGEVNFVILTLLGNLSILAIAILLFKSTTIPIQEKAYLYLIPSIFIIINLTYWELSFWAMASIQNFGVIALAFASLYFLLHEKSKNIYLSILFAIFATFSSGNGMMVFFAGITVIVLNKRINYNLAIYGISGIASILLYFYQFSKPNNFPFLIENLIQNPSTIILYGLNFMGSLFREHNALIAGTILLVYIFYITFKGYATKNPILFSFILFILFTIAPLSFARSFLGVEQALSSRYAINSLVLFVCTYFSLIEITKEKLSLWPIPIIAIIFIYLHIKSYSNYLPEIKNRKENFTSNYNNAISGDTNALNKIIPIELYNTKGIISQADSSAIFKNKKIINHLNRK